MKKKTLRYIQYLLIRLVVGKRPVMMNISCVVEVDTKALNAIFVGNTFKCKSNK